MKKILLVLLVTFQSYLIFGQGATATIPHLTATPGTVVVPVNVTGFDSIVSIGIYFDYDPTVLTYTTSSNPALSGMLVNSYQVGSLQRIAIVWSSSVPKGSNVSGKLVDIIFNYNSGSSNFTFIPAACLVKQRYNLVLNTVSVSYTNGSISLNNSALVSIPQLLNQTPTNGLAIPLNVDFSNIAGGVNAFTFIVEYDPARLQYQNIANNVLGVTIIPQTNPTRLSIQWEYIGSPGSSLNGKLIDIVFNYLGGTTPLTFDENNCEIADDGGLAIPGIYIDGLVSQPVVSVTAGNVAATPGSIVLIPVTVNNFTNIGAFDLIIDYNESVLGAFGNYELVNINPLIEPLLNLASNPTSTGVGINWIAGSYGSGITIPAGGKLFDIKFNYISGTTQLTFDQVNSSVGSNNLVELDVTYVNGAVTQTATGLPTAIIPEVLGTPLSSVEIPINVTGFSNLGAFDLVINYTGVLDFTDLINEQSELATLGTFNFYEAGSTLSVGWTINDIYATEGVNVPDGKLFDMIFYYNGGNSDLVFDLANCVVTEVDGSTTLAVSYTNGSISPSGSKTLNLNLFLEGLFNTTTGQMNKAQDFISGSLINKYPGTVADHITVELHDASAYATIIYTATDIELNLDGSASITVPSTHSGSYYITIRQRNHIETVSATAISFASASVSYNFTTLASQAYGNNQKLLAAGKYGLFVGDVNQDGSVNATDRSLVNSGVIAINKGYIAEDVNGDGVVNATDRSMVNSAVINIVQRIIP